MLDRVLLLLLFVWFSDSGVCVVLWLSGFGGQELKWAVGGLGLVTMGLFCFGCLDLVVRGD